MSSHRRAASGSNERRRRGTATRFPFTFHGRVAQPHGGSPPLLPSPPPIRTRFPSHPPPSRSFPRTLPVRRRIPWRGGWQRCATRFRGSVPSSVPPSISAPLRTVPARCAHAARLGEEAAVEAEGQPVLEVRGEALQDLPPLPGQRI